MSAKPALGIGLFFGALFGYFLFALAHSESREESYRAYDERTRGGRGGAAREEGDAPRGHGEGQDRAMASLAKVHFMKKFVAALVSKPQNAHPSPAWASPLKDPSNPIQCADCHDPKVIDVERMKGSDPGAEAVERYRRDPRFMIPLMTKWVERLNKLHAGRLAGEVTCRTCHAVDPREKFEVYPYFMATFVRALSARPTTNREPASRWKPLLRDPQGAPVLCSTCHHGDTGPAMDRSFLGAELPRPEKYAGDKAFMVDLMQEWVSRLNREAADRIIRPVVCSDCHETDPRR
ncbi:MAG: hypothetical protein ACREID_09500 [Planctomycetota bacterium]